MILITNKFGILNYYVYLCLINLKQTIMAEIVNAYVSKCCSHSVSSNNGSKDIPKHYYTCNKCNKVTEMLEIPYWEITDKGKYKKLQ